MHNTGLSTAPRGGKRPGPKQGPSDQDINLQITRPPPTFATKKIMCKLEDLNLGTKRKEVKKWKEIVLANEKKFNFVTVIDFGLVRSTNENKKKELRKRRQLEKGRKTAIELGRQLDLEDIARKKRNNFFKIQEEKKSLKKRKREDNLMENVEDNQKVNRGKKQKEDNQVGDVLPELPSIEAHHLVKGGKVNNLKLFFNNLTSKGGDPQRGQQECLANLANQKQDRKIVVFGPSLTEKAVIGGDFGLGRPRANENAV